MKVINIIYWVTTGLLSLLMLASGIGDLLHAAPIVENFNRIGVPLYYLPLFGVLKILGVITILLPAAARLREGAYAGMLFYAIGAIYSHIAMGDAFTDSAASYIMLLLVLASYLSSLKVRVANVYH